jgi:hypothetical protein
VWGSTLDLMRICVTLIWAKFWMALSTVDPKHQQLVSGTVGSYSSDIAIRSKSRNAI